MDGRLIVRRLFFALFALIVASLLAGCERGPDADALRKDVTARLAQALPPGTVEVADLRRQGSQTDRRGPPGEDRRVVYFDAELKLTRDFDFGAWDAPGVAGLISALGAAPKGVQGIALGGNKAGDIIRAHGAAVYREENGRWVPVVSGGYRPVTAPAYAASAPQGAAAMLEAVRRIVESVPAESSPEQHAMITQELAAAHASIRARLARAKQGYPLAAGAEGGQYLRFAQALAANPGARVVPLVTRGGDENLRMLRQGKASLALAQADAALDAYRGDGDFAADGPFTSLRAIGSLYPEAVHVLVRADAAVKTVADLRGKRIAIGEKGGASQRTALRVLAAHGLKPADFAGRELGINASLVALRQGEVDAVIQIIGVPSESIRDALAAIPLRLLPLGDKAAAALADSGRGYFRYTVPAGTYANQAASVATVAVAAQLLVAADLSDAEVGAIARNVYAPGADFTARGSAQGAQIAPATATQGLSVPQHLAAARAIEALIKGGAPARQGR
ncbi:Transporter periplasmic component [Cupriavidus sp. H18C1]|uniref:TAXI family TRAP transporter solute-binding subunit n=1 Tax=Cupriavidus sp. H18C1 TaxID=3241601 RepID=UPI003BB8898F